MRVRLSKKQREDLIGELVYVSVCDGFTREYSYEFFSTMSSKELLYFLDIML